MSDCCELPAPAAVTDDRCQRCGQNGRRVSRETLESLLKREARERLTEDPYNFDSQPQCDVVYFSNESRSYFYKSDLTARVGSKETEPPIPLCYCFGHTLGTVRDEILATGRSSVPKRIAREVQAGNCSCETKNPSGKCCLGDVHRAIRRIQQELEEGPVARSERG